MLSSGGVVLLDDVNYESIHKLVQYILNYPACRMTGVAGTPPQPPSVLGRLRRGLSNRTDERSFGWYVDF